MAEFSAMKAKIISIWISSIFIMVSVTRASTLEFSRKTLGLEIKTELFGASFEKFLGAKKLNPEEYDGAVNWYRTDETSGYERDHPGRTLRFGFKNGRLDVIRLSTEMGFDSDEKKAAEKRKTLSKLFADFKKLSGEKLTYQDKNLRVRYESFCSPSENLFAKIYFTLPQTD